MGWAGVNVLRCCVAPTYLLSRIQIALGWLFAASLVVVAVAADFPVPYRDDWDILANVLVPLGPAAIAQRVNEHFIPLPWLITRMHYALEGAVGPSMLVVALGMQAVGVATVVREIRYRWADDGDMARLVVGAALAVMCFSYQLQSLVFDAAVMFPMVQTFATAAIACHLTAMDARGPSVRRRWTVFAFGASLAAVLSTTSGLAVPWVLVLMSLLYRERLRAGAAHAGLGTAAVLAYVVTGAAESGRVVDHSPRSISDAVAFFLAFPSSFLSYLGSAVAIGVGTVVVTASVAAVWSAARRWPAVPRVERFAAGLLVFAGLNAAMLAASRSGFGVIQGAQSRYATFTVAGWAALITFACSRWMPDERAGRRWAAVLLVAGSLALAPVHVFSALVWLAKADHLATVRQALVVGVRDVEWTRTLTPGRPVEAVVALLVARGDRSLTDGRLGQSVGLSYGRTCAGRLSLVRPPNEKAGWRVVGVLDELAADMVIADRNGLVRGLARPAPITTQSEPQPIDVVRAVVNAIGSRSARKAWIGFSQDGAGPPYVGYATAADGSVCRLDVTN